MRWLVLLLLLPRLLRIVVVNSLCFLHLLRFLAIFPLFFAFVFDIAFRLIFIPSRWRPQTLEFKGSHTHTRTHTTEYMFNDVLTTFVCTLNNFFEKPTHDSRAEFSRWFTPRKKRKTNTNRMGMNTEVASVCCRDFSLLLLLLLDKYKTTTRSSYDHCRVASTSSRQYVSLVCIACSVWCVHVQRSLLSFS